MSGPRVFIKRDVYDRLRKHVCSTDFEYETGGILLGYKWSKTFGIIACTFPYYNGNVQATKMSFTLNGEEHTKEMEKIREKYIFCPELIGVWHSHTTKDDSLSVQDRKSNGILVRQIGEMLSIIITPTASKTIQLTTYYISKDNREILCRNTKI